MKRIQNVESSLSLAQSGVGGDADADDISAQGSKLFRLYKEIGRPGQEGARRLEGDWTPDDLLGRSLKAWEQVKELLGGGTAIPRPLHLSWIDTLATLSRPDGPNIYLEAALTDYQNMAGASEDGVDASMVAAAAWCLGVERGCEVLGLALARQQTNQGGGGGREEALLAQVAKRLGDASASFDLVEALAVHASLPAAPSLFEAWALALGTRRGAEGQFQLALKALLETGGGGAGTRKGSTVAAAVEAAPNQVRNAMLVVAVQDQSAKAMAFAAKTLKTFQSPSDQPSNAALSGLLKWCANQPPSLTLKRFGPAHTWLLAVEDSMAACGVEPTPSMLSTLLSAYGNAGNVERVFSVLQTLKQQQQQQQQKHEQEARLPPSSSAAADPRAPALRLLSKGVYLAVLRSLRQASVPTPASRDLAADPSALINGLLVDMSAQGVQVDVDVLKAALRVFAQTLRHVELLNENVDALEAHPADRDLIASKAWELFLSTTKGTKWHPAVEPDLDTYNLLLKVFTHANDLNRATGLLEAMAGEEPTLAPTVESYNILLRILAKRDWMGCEDLFTLMTNRNLAPNESTMDGILNGYADSERAPAAVSMAQSVFNQYGAKPTQPVFLRVLELLLQEGDLAEARRAAFVFKQIWPEDTDLLDRTGGSYGFKL